MKKNSEIFCHTEHTCEFSEGMKIGVRSVFSGVVGGTAGAVSKITGGFGKVLAKMTYDEEFQRKRIEGIKKRKNQAWPLHSALLFKFLGRYIYWPD